MCSSDLWCQNRVVTKIIFHNLSERGEDFGEFVDKRREDVYCLAQARIISPAEEGPSELPLIVEACTDRMS